MRRKSRTRLSPAQVRAIARAYTGTPKNIERLCRLYNLGPRQPRLVARRGGNPLAAQTRSRLTQVDLAVVRRKYADTSAAEIAAEIGRSTASVYQAAKKLGLKKSREFLSAIGRNPAFQRAGKKFRIKKGAVPPNKGKKMPPGWAPGRMASTQFKKGMRSGAAGAHWMPIGTEREIEGYLYRKVADVQNVPYTVNWKQVHVLLWEQANGPVPPKHILRFKDGNRRNFDLANLELLSLSENMKRNTIHRYPRELRDVIRLQARLERTIERRQSA